MRRLACYGAFVLVFLACVPWVAAQTAQGVVTGTVFDPSGAIVPEATVKLTNEGTNITQTATTGSAGNYRLSLVPPGTYTVSAKAPGFAEKVVKGIIVRVSQTVPLDINLAVAQAAQAVEVTAATPLVETATSDLTHTIERTTLENTPLLSRNIYDLAFVAPQVTQGLDMGASSGGARESGTAVLLNGSDNNDNFSEASANITPPLESVSEFTLLTNSMAAQYGRAAGAIISAVQKTGTNNFHGVAYEFNRNRSLNASDFFNNRNQSPKPKYIRNQFGGEIDGPIVKNKAFFSFAYDQVTLHTGSDLIVQGPTPAELAAIQSGAGPIAQSYLPKYPPFVSSALCPNEARDFPAAIGHIGCTHLFDPATSPAKNYYGRVDYNIGDKDRLSFTANINRFANIDTYGGGHPSTKPINGTDREHYHNLTLVETHVFGPRLFNELTVAHNRHYSVFVEGDGTIRDPELGIDGLNFGGIGFGFGAYSGGLVEGFVQDRWQLQDNVGLTIGRHSIKFGGSFQSGILYRNWDLGLPGFYEFGNTTGPTAAQAGALNPDGSITNVDQGDSNFQKDFPYFEEVSINPTTGTKANAYRHYIMKDSNLFIQDDFKVTPRLTLNLGLRWERYGAPTEQHNVLAQFQNFNCLTGGFNFKTCIANARIGPAPSMWNTRNKDFAPRLGFAYDMFGDGRTSLRAGFGISYDRLFDNIWSNGAWNPPFYALFDADATSGDTIFYNDPAAVVPSYVPNSLPGPAGRVSVRTMENTLKDSSVQNYYGGIEHQFGRNVLLRVNYQGSLGRHLSVLMNWNRSDGICYTPRLSCVRPNSLYTGFNYRSNNVTSNYNSLVAEIQKRYSNGLQFQGGYTWGHLLDFGSDLFQGSTLIGGYSQPYYFVSNSHKNLEYGSGGFDHRHGFKLNASYELPFMRDQKGVLGHIAGGWQLSGFYQFYTGFPIEVYTNRTRFRGNVKDANGIPENLGGDYDLDFVRNDHPDFVGGSFSSVYSNKSPADGIFKDSNLIGCGFPGQQSTNTAACNAAFGVVTPNSLFVNPPGTGVRFGRLGRNTFTGPRFNGLDAAIFKNFRIRETQKLQLRVEALNGPNHPNFAGVTSNLNDPGFGKAQILVGSAPARRFQIGMRYIF